MNNNEIEYVKYIIELIVVLSRMLSYWLEVVK